MREKGSLWTEWWARASKDNTPLSELPNCWNLNHSLSTSAILTKIWRKGKYNYQVKVNTSERHFSLVSQLLKYCWNCGIMFYLTLSWKSMNLELNLSQSGMKYVKMLTFGRYSVDSDPVCHVRVRVFGTCLGFWEHNLTSKRTHIGNEADIWNKYVLWRWVFKKVETFIATLLKKSLNAGMPIQPLMTLSFEIFLQFWTVSASVSVFFKNQILVLISISTCNSVSH